MLAVELDGEPWVALEEADLVRLGWRTGTELDSAARREGEQAARRAAVERRAARLLASRPHARAELEAKLARTGGGAEARDVTRRFEEAGWIDDEAFAARLAERRLAQGYGPGRIRDDLERAGVARGLVAQVVAGLDGELVAAALRRAAGVAPSARDWRRLVGRGFEPDLVEDLLGPLVESDPA